jgi:hypothetical protein
MFRELNLFLPSDKSKTPTLLGPLKRTTHVSITTGLSNTDNRIMCNRNCDKASTDAKLRYRRKSKLLQHTESMKTGAEENLYYFRPTASIICGVKPQHWGVKTD